MEYDIIMLGHISKDLIIDEHGQETRLYGGALLYSSISAARAGARVLAITKAAAEDFRALGAVKSEKTSILYLSKAQARPRFLTHSFS